jgi:hypothetical protein
MKPIRVCQNGKREYLEVPADAKKDRYNCYHWECPCIRTGICYCPDMEETRRLIKLEESGLGG